MFHALFADLLSRLLLGARSKEYKIAYIVTGLYIVFCVNLYACMVVVRARYSGAHVDACTEVYNFVVT